MPRASIPLLDMLKSGGDPHAAPLRRAKSSARAARLSCMRNLRLAHKAGGEGDWEVSASWVRIAKTYKRAHGAEVLHIGELLRAGNST